MPERVGSGRASGFTCLRRHIVSALPPCVTIYHAFMPPYAEYSFIRYTTPRLWLERDTFHCILNRHTYEGDIGYCHYAIHSHSHCHAGTPRYRATLPGITIRAIEYLYTHGWPYVAVPPQHATSATPLVRCLYTRRRSARPGHATLPLRHEYTSQTFMFVWGLSATQHMSIQNIEGHAMPSRHTPLLTIIAGYCTPIRRGVTVYHHYEISQRH